MLIEMHGWRKIWISGGPLFKIKFRPRNFRNRVHSAALRATSLAPGWGPSYASAKGQFVIIWRLVAIWNAYYTSMAVILLKLKDLSFWLNIADPLRFSCFPRGWGPRKIFKNWLQRTNLTLEDVLIFNCSTSIIWALFPTSHQLSRKNLYNFMTMLYTEQSDSKWWFSSFFIFLPHGNSHNIPLHYHTITVFLDLFGVKPPKNFWTCNKNCQFQGCGQDLTWGIPASEFFLIAVLCIQNSHMIKISLTLSGATLPII
jgi:hypothetical protein